MVDPVSISCAVITFGILIKQSIELAQNVLEKVPKSRKKLRSLSADVVRGLLDLEKFHDQHKHHLDGSVELQVALDSLGSELHAVYTHCCELFPPQASGRIDNVVAALKAWNKCREIESEILDLKGSVQACYIRFTAFSAVRLEQSTFHIEQSTSRTEQSTSHIEHNATRIERTLLVLRDEQRSGLSSIQSRVAMLQTYTRLDSNNAAPPLSSGSNNSSHLSDISNLYLHQQVDDIAKSLEHLSLKTFKSEEPRGRYLSPFRTFVPHRETQDSSLYHLQVVKNALQILILLKDDSVELSIQDGAWDMLELANDLSHLEMYADAVTIGVWTVDLYRTLCKTQAPVFEPYLAFALQNLSIYCRDAGDIVRAIPAIEESVKIHRALLNSPTSDFRPRLASALVPFCVILSEKGESEKRLEFAQESVDILQNVFRDIVEWETQVQSEPGPLQYSNQSENRETSTEDSFEDATYLLPPNASARHRLCCDYDASLMLESDMAFAFRNLARGLDDVGHHSKAYDMDILALAIFRDLYSRHPGTFAPKVAESLCFLSRPLPTVDRPQSDIFLFAEEAAQIYRELRSRYPTKFSKGLFEALWYQAFSLWDSGNPDKALKISSEAIEFIRQSHNDRLLLADSLNRSSYFLRCLKQDKDAVKLRQEAVDIYRDLMHNPPSTKLVLTIMPDRLLNLADDLQLVGRFDEAVIANREAVERYRSIALGDNTRTPDLAKALSSLLRALNNATKHDEVLDVGQEVLKLYRKLIRDDPNLIHTFLRALRRCAFAACHSDDPEAIRRSAEIVQDYRTLMAHYSNTVGWGLVDALRDHGFVLEKHRRYPEGLLNSEGLVRLFKSIPVESAETAAKFINSFHDHADMLEVAGHVKKATAVIKDAIAVAEPFIADSNDLVDALAESFSNISVYLRMSGQYEDALAKSEKSVELGRRRTSPDHTWFAGMLNMQCAPLVKAGRFADAVAVGEEAVSLCRTSMSEDLFAPARLPLALEHLSNCVAEAGDEGKALGIVEEAVNLYQDIQSKNTVPWGFVEDIYADALVSLSARLAANGHLQDALEHTLLAKSIYEMTITSGKLVSYLPLVTTLHLLSILFCAVGRHPEGVAAADDLVEKKRVLEVVHPELATLVQVRLNDQNTRPSYLALRRKIPQCACDPNHLKDSCE